jgi:hypothetical protein
MSSDLITAKPSNVWNVPRITGPVKHPSFCCSAGEGSETATAQPAASGRLRSGPAPSDRRGQLLSRSRQTPTHSVSVASRMLSRSSFRITRTGRPAKQGGFVSIKQLTHSIVTAPKVWARGPGDGRYDRSVCRINFLPKALIHRSLASSLDSHSRVGNDRGEQA